MLHLHTHSVYSYKDAIAKVDDIATTLQKQGEDAFCITDHGSLTNFIKSFQVAKDHNMQFIPGYEGYLQPQDEIFQKTLIEKTQELKRIIGLKKSTPEEIQEAQDKLNKINKIRAQKYHHITLIAMNQDGLNNLFKIYNEENLYYKYLLSRNSLFNHSDGLIVLSGCFNGEAIYHIRNKDFDKAREILNLYKNKFRDRFFIELQFHNLEMRDWEVNRGLLNEVETYNKLIKLGRELDIPFVITNDSHYIYEEEYMAHNLYKAVCYDQDEEVGADYTNGGYYLTTEDDIRKRIGDLYPKWAIDQAFDNIKKIRSMCEECYFPTGALLTDHSQELYDRCVEGWKKLRVGTEYEQESRERFEYELSVINKKNFSEYFIKVKTITDTAKKLNILVGPGRGSGCGSEVCYLLGITYVDPLKYGLFFERFLNEYRNNYPDIDLDFATVSCNAYR